MIKRRHILENAKKIQEQKMTKIRSNLQDQYSSILQESKRVCLY